MELILKLATRLPIKIYNKIASPLFWVLSDLVEFIIRPIPGRIGPWNLGYAIRSYYWGLKCKSFGKNVLIQENVFLYFPHNISIGSNVSVTANCILSAYSEAGEGELTLGDDIFIGPGTYFFTVNHDYLQPNFKQTLNYVVKPVVIESNVWLGSKVGVLPGVTVGTGSVVAMGAVVSKDIPPNSIAAGVPAKVIKKITRPTP